MRMILFLVSFLLAFLLFSVQPMATKMVLPTLGGTPAVWNTVIFTFQCLLLLGYAYAHLLAAHVAPRWQWRVHTLLVTASCLMLPLSVHLNTSDAMLAQPIPYLIAAFLMQLGLPFFALAATQPLLQSWLTRSAHPMAQSPYVLYSASNLGSFAGLFGYILLAEPLLGLSGQSAAWAGLYVLGMLALLAAGRRLRPAAAVVAAKRPHTPRRYALWVGLAFLPSSLSLGVTSYITTDVASVPLLWVLPLAIYLLSYVDAFRTRPVLVRACQYLAPVAGMGALLLYGLQAHRFALGFPLHLASFAVLAFALHGWLAALKPEPAQLTRFYLCLSVGGALGGMLNGLAAPLLLREALEYPLVLLAASITAFLLLQRKPDEPWLHAQLRAGSVMLLRVLGLTALFYLLFDFLDTRAPAAASWVHSQNLVMAACFAAVLSVLLWRRYANAFYAAAAVGLVMLLAVSNGVTGFATLFKDRNFFGVMRVYENPHLNARYIMHDTTLHGMQSLLPGEALRPLSYYGQLGSVFDGLPVMRAAPLGVVGLGVGTLNCFAADGQRVDFFEINPLVEELARDPRYFNHLRDCPGEARVLLGDGRVRLAQQPDASYGAIVLDAFSSDAIPAHLLTREAMQVYLDKLRPGGVLLLHTTNRHLELGPLVAAHAEAMGFAAYGKLFRVPRGETRLFNCYWIVIGRTQADLAPLVEEDAAWQPLHSEGDRPWTDQYINILPFLKILR